MNNITKRNNACNLLYCHLLILLTKLEESYEIKKQSEQYPVYWVGSISIACYEELDVQYRNGTINYSQVNGGYDYFRKNPPSEVMEECYEELWVLRELIEEEKYKQ